MSTSPTVNADNPIQVLKLLKKKGRASAAELGADKAILEFLIAEGFVKKDGTIKREGAGRGRPPIGYAPAFDYDPNEAPVYKAPVQRDRKEVSQAQVDKVVAEVKNSTYGGACSCVVTKPGITAEEIRDLGAGCTDPNYVCPALDAVRRRGKLFDSEPVFQEVV